MSGDDSHQRYRRERLRKRPDRCGDNIRNVNESMRRRNAMPFSVSRFLAGGAALIILACIGVAQAQVTSNVLLRVLRVQAGNDLGTAFTLDVDGRQYLVTAKHVVATLKPEDTVKIFKDGTWTSLGVKVFRCDDPIDIAVLSPPSQLTVSYALEPGGANMFYGQDAYLVGFPYGKFFTNAKGIDSPRFPVPDSIPQACSHFRDDGA